MLISAIILNEFCKYLQLSNNKQETQEINLKTHILLLCYSVQLQSFARNLNQLNDHLNKEIHILVAIYSKLVVYKSMRSHASLVQSEVSRYLCIT